MAIYAIGDIQGCYTQFMQLLEKIKFDSEKDTLWLTGDLVNRGNQSLETLRFIQNLGQKAVCVLGNHDLALLAVARAGINIAHNCHDILSVPDAEVLLGWLQSRPLLHYDPTKNLLLVHAGILPNWDLKTAMALAGEVQAILKSDLAIEFFKNLYGNYPDQWDPTLTGFDRIRFIVNVFTRLRFCTQKGQLEFQTKTSARNAPKGFAPWFDLYQQKHPHTQIIFGHWAALEKIQYGNCYGLDTGCVWGNCLTALRLEDKKIFQIDCGKN